MLVTQLGIVTLAIAGSVMKASVPMVVTGSPAMVAGMLKLPVEPGQPLMVIVPFVGVQKKGAENKNVWMLSSLAPQRVVPAK